MTHQHYRPSLPTFRRRVNPWVFAVIWPALVACMPAHAQPGAVAGASQLGPSVKRGQVLFETHCMECHAVDRHRAGPALRGVVGRVAGKAPDFFYSQALESATHVWDKPKLKAWLSNPESVVPGQEMNFQLDSARDRDDVVAYLSSLVKRGKP